MWQKPVPIYSLIASKMPDMSMPGFSCCSQESKKIFLTILKKSWFQACLFVLVLSEYTAAAAKILNQSRWTNCTAWHEVESNKAMHGAKVCLFQLKAGSASSVFAGVLQLQSLAGWLRLFASLTTVCKAFFQA